SAESDRDKVTDAVKLRIAGYILKSKFSLKAMLERIKTALESPTPAVLSADASSAAAAPTSAQIASETSAQHSRGSNASVAAAAQASAPALQSRGAPSKKVGVDEFGASGVKNAKEAERELAATRPLITKTDLLGRVAKMDSLKGFSPAVSQVVKLASSSRCSVDEVAK